jgi:hypothetical protein
MTVELERRPDPKALSVDHVVLLTALTAVGARHPKTLIGVSVASNVRAPQLAADQVWSRVDVGPGVSAAVSAANQHGGVHSNVNTAAHDVVEVPPPSQPTAHVAPSGSAGENASVDDDWSDGGSAAAACNADYADVDAADDWSDGGSAAAAGNADYADVDAADGKVDMGTDGSQVTVESPRYPAHPPSLLPFPVPSSIATPLVSKRRPRSARRKHQLELKECAAAAAAAAGTRGRVGSTHTPPRGKRKEVLASEIRALEGFLTRRNGVRPTIVLEQSKEATGGHSVRVVIDGVEVAKAHSRKRDIARLHAVQLATAQVYA